MYVYDVWWCCKTCLRMQMYVEGNAFFFFWKNIISFPTLCTSCKPSELIILLNLYFIIRSIFDVFQIIKSEMCLLSFWSYSNYFINKS